MGKSKSYQKLLDAPYQLIAIMTLIVVFITCIALYRLYIIGFEEQKSRLTEFVQSQAVLINKMVEHEISDHPESKKEEIEYEVLSL